MGFHIFLSLKWHLDCWFLGNYCKTFVVDRASSFLKHLRLLFEDNLNSKAIWMHNLYISTLHQWIHWCPLPVIRMFRLYSFGQLVLYSMQNVSFSLVRWSLIECLIFYCHIPSVSEYSMLCLLCSCLLLYNVGAPRTLPTWMYPIIFSVTRSREKMFLSLLHGNSSLHQQFPSRALIFQEVVYLLMHCGKSHKLSFFY